MAQFLGSYYNEHDPKAAAWLRELIKGGHIAPGEVDERDIRDVCPDDIRGFTQHHFFAGIGVWSYALRQAGWPDDRPVWTGSCPCQPFSSAGKRKGTDDDRHLWPAFGWLIRQHRPGVVFGEQVASKDGIAWLDIVSTDLEREGYAIAPTVLPACGVGAPHQRSRLWFVADTHGGNTGPEWQQRSREQRLISADGGSLELAHTGIDRAGKHPGELSGDEGQHEVGTTHGDHSPVAGGAAGALAIDSSGGRRVMRSPLEPEPNRHADGSINSPGWVADPSGEQCDARRIGAEGIESGSIVGPTRHGSAGGSTDVEGSLWPAGAGPVNGHWRSADWIFCRDGKWRPVEPGSFPLAHGAAGRVGRLRGYGNAIVAQAAAEVIRAYMEVRDVR